MPMLARTASTRPGSGQQTISAPSSRAVAPKPVNVLVGGSFTTVEALAALGVRRISVGGALARAAWAGFLHAAAEIADEGTFTALDSAIPFSELDGSFGDR